MSKSSLIISFSIVCRILQGLENSITMSCLYAMAPGIWPMKVEIRIGQMEAACALGQIVAPIIGNYLYIFGGLFLPYLIVSGLILLSLITN